MPTPEYVVESKQLLQNTGPVMEDMFQSEEAQELHEKHLAQREAAHQAEVEYLARERQRRQKQREVEAEEKQQRYEVARAVEEERLKAKRQRSPTAEQMEDQEIAAFLAGEAGDTLHPSLIATTEEEEEERN